MQLFRANVKINVNQFKGGQGVSEMEISGYESKRSKPKAQKPMASHHRRKCAPVVTATNTSLVFISAQRSRNDRHLSRAEPMTSTETAEQRLPAGADSREC